MAFPFGGGLALIRPQFGRSIRVGGVGTPVYGTSSQFEPSGVARFRTQPDVDGTGLSPTFSVDWTTSTSLPAVLSLSRASSGTYFDSSGVLQTATSNTPRFDYKYNGTSWVEAGLLIEEQRTNSVPSNDFSSAAWTTANGAGLTVGSTVTGPAGASTAYPLTPSTSNGPHEVRLSSTLTSSASVCYSCFVKPNGYTQIAIREVGSTGAAATFLLSGAGSVVAIYSATVTVTNAVISALDNGYYRISVIIGVPGGTINMALLPMDGGYTSGDPDTYHFSGNGTSGVIAYGPQMEVGGFLTSYIPTTGTAATRSADIISSTDTGLLAAQGWVVEVGELPGSTAATLLGINTAIGLGATSGNALTTADGGTQTSGNTGTWTGLNRGGIAFDTTPRVSIDLDGGTVVTAGNTPVTPTSLYFGNTNNGASDFLNGHLRMMAAYTAVTDSQLAIISAVGAPFTIGGGGTSDAAGTAASTSTVAAIGSSLAASTGSAAGTSTGSGVGAALGIGVGSAAGTSTVIATGKALVNGVGSAAGTSTATATGAALANSVGNAAGTSTVLATGRSTAASVGASAGVSTVSGVGAGIAASIGSAAGTSADTATGSSLAKGVGNAAGTSTALAVSGTVAAAAGTSTVTGVGAALFKAVGAAAGTSTVTATGVGAAFAVGVSSGTSTVSGIGKSLAVAVGSAAGVGTAAGASPSLIMQAVGLATGNSIVVGVGNAHRPGTWQIAVRGTMDIPTPWKIGNTAIDTIPNVPETQSIYSDSTPDIYQVGDIYSQTAQNTWKVATRGNMDVQTAWKIAR